MITLVTQAEQGRLAEAASDLVAFLANANVGSLAPWGQRIEAAASGARSIDGSPVHSPGAVQQIPAGFLPVPMDGQGSVRIRPGPARTGHVAPHADPQAMV